MEELKRRGVEPELAMRRFAGWIEWTTKLDRENCRAVFAGFNAPFDWMFVNWYFHTFLWKNSFGISGLDIKAYYMGMMATPWSETVKRKIKKRFPVALPHTHNALDDAREQAELLKKLFEFNRLRQEKLRALGIA